MWPAQPPAWMSWQQTSRGGWRKILDHLLVCLFTRVVILEQHKHSPLHYFLYNILLRNWHMSIDAFHRIDERISFQKLQGLNGNRWFHELSDGVHLTTESQWDYLCTIHVIRKSYHLHMPLYQLRPILRPSACAYS